MWGVHHEYSITINNTINDGLTPHPSVVWGVHHEYSINSNTVLMITTPHTTELCGVSINSIINIILY